MKEVKKTNEKQDKIDKELDKLLVRVKEVRKKNSEVIEEFKKYMKNS